MPDMTVCMPDILKSSKRKSEYATVSVVRHLLSSHCVPLQEPNLFISLFICTKQPAKKRPGLAETGTSLTMLVFDCGVCT